MTTPYETVIDSSDRAAWLEARRTGIGASDSPVLLGLSTYSSPVQLWAEKVGRTVSDDSEQTDRQRWGIKLEPLVAEEYERQTGRQLNRWATLVRSTRWPFMLATPDYSTFIDGIHAPVEIKTTDHSRASDWADGVPDRVNVQLQHQLAVLDAPMASVGLLVGGNTFRWADVPRDEKVIKHIIESARGFWQLVADEILPSVDDGDVDALKRLYPVATPGKSILLPGHAIAWAEELAAAKAEKGEAEIRVKLVEAQLRAAMGDAEVGEMADGSPPFTLRTTTRKAYSVAATTYRALRRAGE